MNYNSKLPLNSLFVEICDIFIVLIITIAESNSVLFNYSYFIRCRLTAGGYFSKISVHFKWLQIFNSAAHYHNELKYLKSALNIGINTLHRVIFL